MMVQIKGNNIFFKTQQFGETLKCFSLCCLKFWKKHKCHELEGLEAFLRNQRPKSIFDYGELSPDRYQMMNFLITLSC